MVRYRDGCIDPEAAARALGVEYVIVLRLVESGRLPANILDTGAIRINPDSLEALASRQVVVPLRRRRNRAA